MTTSEMLDSSVTEATADCGTKDAVDIGIEHSLNEKLMRLFLPGYWSCVGEEKDSLICEIAESVIDAEDILLKEFPALLNNADLVEKWALVTGDGEFRFFESFDDANLFAISNHIPEHSFIVREICHEEFAELHDRIPLR